MSLEAPQLFTHDLNQVIVTITVRSTGQEITIVGKAGDGIQINITEPKYADIEVSDDGKIAVRSVNNKRISKIMITGVQYSPIHKQLVLLYTADPENDIIDVNVSDLSNRILYSALGAYLSKFADVQYATAQGNRTHEITAPFIEMDKDLT